jgi:hypothetical protein
MKMGERWHFAMASKDAGDGKDIRDMKKRKVCEEVGGESGTKFTVLRETWDAVSGVVLCMVMMVRVRDVQGMGAEGGRRKGGE